MKKTLAGILLGTSIFMAGCSSSTSYTLNPDIETDLEITQEWNGNSVALSLFDSEGNDCAVNEATVGSECYGFYIGWAANFDDADRVVDYSKIGVTTISELEVGDSGNFLLMYQDPADSNSEVSAVKDFPFEYKG
jgi:hypothetical protein